MRIDFKYLVYLILAVLAVGFLCLTLHAQAQDSYLTYKGCPLGGKPLSYDDSMKNRYLIPDSYAEVPFDQLAGLKIMDALPKGPIAVTGYCILVKDGGAETCNCKTSDKTQWDTHIELTKDSQHTKGIDALICEVNGRVRDILGKKGQDYSTKTLKHNMVGHKVKIYGYPFYDDHHKQNSEVDNPKGTTLWRHTTLEIHPVTRIEVLD